MPVGDAPSILDKESVRRMVKALGDFISDAAAVDPEGADGQ